MNVTIGWPQALVLLFMFIPVVVAIVNDGKEKREMKRYNWIPVSLRCLGGVALLSWGGFFQ